jgi:hypothetical protein
MKINKLYFIFVFFMMLFSCKKDFLDRTPGADLSEGKVFSNPVLSAQYADNAYNFLVDEYARFNAHRGTTSQASDEAVSGNTDVSVRTLNQGLFHDHYERGGASLNDIGDIWQRAYAGIRVTNTMISKMDSIPWTAAQSPSKIMGEMRFIRAFLYFELIKRFGGVPIIDKAYSIFDNVDLPRNTYNECVNFIINDLTIAQGLLPTDYSSGNYGRATEGAAKALKTRVLLYAASPLNNPTNDRAKWLLAVNAAREVISMNKYTLTGQSYDDLMNVSQSPEYIMIKVRAPRAINGFLLDFVMSPGSGGAQGSMNPTQNHVDLYQMQATGLSITNPASGYNPNTPYIGRDPRFKANILFNDADWQGRKMGMWTQTSSTGVASYGLDYRPNNIIYTATGYYCKKMWPEVYVRNTTQRALFNFIFFRYGEVLLNYAEALNEYSDLQSDRVTAISALNTIRNRVNMPQLPNTLTKNELREAIINERAVELAFEDFRWYDLMRWKKSAEIINKPVKGVEVVKNTNGTFSYSTFALQNIYQKKFEEYMYLYPIPRTEIFKSNGILNQNPQW